MKSYILMCIRERLQVGSKHDAKHEILENHGFGCFGTVSECVETHRDVLGVSKGDFGADFAVLR